MAKKNKTIIIAEDGIQTITGTIYKTAIPSVSYGIFEDDALQNSIKFFGIESEEDVAGFSIRYLKAAYQPPTQQVNGGGGGGSEEHYKKPKPKKKAITVISLDGIESEEKVTKVKIKKTKPRTIIVKIDTIESESYVSGFIVEIKPNFKDDDAFIFMLLAA